jgi:hypothetical protein
VLLPAMERPISFEERSSLRKTSKQRTMGATTPFVVSSRRQLRKMT